MTAASSVPPSDSDEALPAFRIEHDSMGDVSVPADAKWQAQTQRAVENFPISGLTVEPRLIRALALIKGAAAVVNAGLKDVSDDKRIAEAIAAAADEVADGALGRRVPDRRVPDRLGHVNQHEHQRGHRQPGQRAAAGGRPVHPNDHVNTSQSSNDVFPSAIHLAARDGDQRELMPALEHLATRCGASGGVREVVKTGRTHLMDATPVTLGPGVRRLRRPDRAGHRAPERPLPAWRAAARAAPRWDRHQRAPGLRRR